MNSDATEVQGDVERRRAAEMSLKRGYPPTKVPGYEPERFLGLGAYGEVWVAREQNTGRRVAIKFYAHRGGLDWSLLSREVEKLAFLFADRYVVQLVGVGWDADPPYYIMEYLEKGSLADRIARGPLKAEEAVTLLRDVAIGLVHAHGKGVLHCDLKPANVLLDQDGKPRLADFGQSRLSTEQAPALGTMFYMAPEQADLEAVPDARWDVYALGALLYCMLTGEPPHRNGKTVDMFERTPELATRLQHYREAIEKSPVPTGHRRRRGVDKMLAAVVDRCLAPDPRDRYPNVQAVLDALEDRSARLARRPTMILGAVAPAILLAVVTLFAWQGFHAAVRQSDAALTDQALKSNGFAAQFAAQNAAFELERRYKLVEGVAASEPFRRQLAETLGKPELGDLLALLGNRKLSETELAPLRQQLRDNAERLALQTEFGKTIKRILKESGDDDVEVASWFFCDSQGVSTVRLWDNRTIGRDFAWRSYFHGGPVDMEESWRPKRGEHLTATTLSDVFPSSRETWTVCVSAPVYDAQDPRKFLGAVGMTAQVGRFVDFPGTPGSQFAVLVDNRGGEHKGVVIEHPLFDKLLKRDHKLPERFKDYRIHADDQPDREHVRRQQNYRDPLAADPEGGDYDRRWLARMEPVEVRGHDTGWAVIVQTAYHTAIGRALDDLKLSLIRSGAIALGLVALVMAAMWGMAKRMSTTSK